MVLGRFDCLLVVLDAAVRRSFSRLISSLCGSGAFFLGADEDEREDDEDEREVERDEDEELRPEDEEELRLDDEEEYDEYDDGVYEL